MITKTAGLLLACLGLPGWSSPTSTGAQEIEWHRGDLAAAKRDATRDEKDILVYFWSETSPACAGFYQNQMQSERVVGATRAFVCFSAQRETDAGRTLFERYGVEIAPTLLVLDPQDESAQDGIFGSTNVPTIVHHLERIARDEETLRDYERRTAAAPDDLDLRGEYARRLAALGHRERSEALLASIREDDPHGASNAAATLYLEDRLRDLFGPAPELTPALVDQLAAYVEEIEPAHAKHEGWDRVALLRNALGDLHGELEARRRAFPHVRDTQLFNWGWTNGLWWWSNRDVLSRKEKAFALEVARKTVAVSERLSAEDPGYYDPGLFLTRRLNMLAMILHMHGEKKEAEALMERCVELYPQSSEYEARLASYAGNDGDGYFNGYSDYDASWSPDGRKVVFTSTRDRNTELYVADVERGKLTRVTRSLASDDQGAFGPKGKHVVFRSDRFKTAGIYRVKASGKDCELLVPLGEDLESPVASGAASYSRDGESLALIRMQEGVPRAMVATADGEDPRVITNDTQGEDSLGWAGDRLVYSSTRNGEKDVFIANPDGTDERKPDARGRRGLARRRLRLARRGARRLRELARGIVSPLGGGRRRREPHAADPR